MMTGVSEHQGIWKEGVVTYLKIFCHFTGVSEENLSWDSWWPSRDSNQLHSEHKSEALPPKPACLVAFLDKEIRNCEVIYRLDF
jgi:hypothetical protein